jgi:hypothetical protein
MPSITLARLARGGERPQRPMEQRSDRAPAAPTTPGARLTLALGAVALLSILLRLPFLSVPLNTDEGGYAYVAYWLDRGLVLYRDLWFDRPQGIFLVYALILRLFGESTEAIRLAGALCNAATTFLLGLLAVRLSDRRAGLAAAGVFALASASPAVEGFTANGELFMNLPVVIALFLATGRRFCWAGVALALATAIKPTALPAALPALLVLLAGGAGGRAGGRAWAAGRLGAGTLLGLAPFIAQGLATDAHTYLYAVVGFRVQAHSAFSVGRPLLDNLLRTAPTVLAALLPVWLLAACGLAGGAGWRARGRATTVAFALGSLVGAAAGGYWYWHYFVGVLPAAALLAGAGASRLLRRPSSWGTRWARLGPGHTAGGAPALGLVSLAVALFFNVRLVGTSPEQTSWLVYRRPAYLASKQIAAYVRARTTAQDTIYAAFAQADLYFLSHRRSAGSQLYWTEINRVPGALDAVLAALDDPARRPKYVIRIDHDLERPGQAASFWTRVDQLYQLETQIGGFLLYRSRDEAGP